MVPTVPTRGPGGNDKQRIIPPSHTYIHTILAIHHELLPFALCPRPQPLSVLAIPSLESYASPDTWSKTLLNRKSGDQTEQKHRNQK